MTTKVFPEQIVLDTDGNLTANSDLRIPSQKAVKSYVDSNSGGETVAVRVYHNAHQSVPSGTYTALTFNSERFDTHGMHDSTNPTRLTCQVPGLYLICGCTYGWDMTYIMLLIKLDGSTYISRIDPSLGTGRTLNLSTIYPLTAGQYVELVFYHNSGSARNVEYQPNYSPEFMMVKIGSVP